MERFEHKKLIPILICFQLYVLVIYIYVTLKSKENIMDTWLITLKKVGKLSSKHFFAFFWYTELSEEIL